MGNQTFTITPSAGYIIATVLVNGQSVGAVSSYTFSNVQSNQSIHATFSQITYTITATAGAGGSISPSGVVTVPQGGSQTFSITPNAGYFIADVLVNGQSVGTVSSYTFTNLQSNQSIHATFTQITHTITATAGTGGNISPSGAVVVPQGGSQTFSITPNAGYVIANVLVNGQSVGAVSSYTFTNVQSNHSIHATFTQITYTITATAGAGGSISPSGAVTVPYMGTQTFTISPSTGYIIATVLVNGQSVGAVSSYTFSNVVSNHQIYAVFTPATYTITATAGPGGSISPSGTFTVNHGSSISFSIQPNAGYRVDSVVVDGQNVGVVNTWQFQQISANHSIAAWFGLITGVDENAESQMIVFPNPSNGQITLRRSRAENAEWHLFDTHGRKVSSGHLDASLENRLNLTVKPGYYYLHIRDKSGTISHVGIVVK